MLYLFVKKLPRGLTAADLLDLARWIEQHRQTLENEL
jgi:hypothetical protein